MDSLSDFDSHSESSSSEDMEDIESLYGGQACTIFSSLEETILKIDDFLLFERGFLHGDIVCLLSDPTGQMGKVVHVDMTVDLENVYGCKIQNVSSKDLHKVRSVLVGDYVVCGAWLGKVDKIVDRMTILFDDGAKCELTTDGPEKIIALSSDLIEDPQYPFYPGQRIQIKPAAGSRSTRWLCGIRKDKHEQGTVCKVEAETVYVDWLCCAIINGERVPPPPCWQDLKNLSMLSCYPHANWQLGDWCILPREHKQSGMQIHGTDNVAPNIQQIAVIAKTKTKVDVLWQDGSQSEGLDSHLLFPVNIIDAHDFWPDAFVLEKVTVDDQQVQRWGIVRSVDPKERTVKVKWCKSSDQRDSEEEQIEEIVSAYELVEHPDFSYCLGEAVFRADKIDDPANRNCETNHMISKIYIGEEGDLKSVESGGEQAEFLNNKFLSCFGTVIGFKHGNIEVKWANGATSKVAPYEIYRVDKCEDTTPPMLSDEIGPLPNEELPVKNQYLGQEIKDVFGLNYDDAKDSNLHSISQVAIGVLTSITSSLFGYLGSSLISGYKCTSEGASKSPEEETLELCDLNLGGQILAIDVSEMYEKTTSLPKEIKEDIMLPSSSKNPESFRQFDMVNDC
ncbi:Ubiquitin--protein ligase [Handroanthus impetiginosus]|uniref:Ubiquitin--protein ligase n=1 Tax=Handroanthus impetiginosus TaxID=429701 RepID=A0A2G9HP82_9LAMI|nr:Ubiquitin--protein ligase [Handroanthus impetiginosus]